MDKDRDLSEEVENKEGGTDKPQDATGEKDNNVLSETENTPTEKSVETKPALDEESKEKEGEENSTDVLSKEIHTEEDLSEKHDEEEHHHEDEHIDYSHHSKEELVGLIKTLKDMDVSKADKILKEIKPLFDDIKEKEKSEALKKFIAEGGEEDDFEYRYDELVDRFDANYKLLRDRKTKHFKDRESQKEENLKKKQDLLEKLREFVDSEAGTNISFDSFKSLQEEWKSIGPVPGANVKTLWANYNALVDRFYDNRSIYFELKELDRRKNLEAKLELCERAEKLNEIQVLKDAIKELNELHHEFKHLGPVPKDEQEALWIRFKTASDNIYAKRKDYIENLKTTLEDNYKLKASLAEEVQQFLGFNSERIKEWNEKTKEILDVQKRWEAIGGLPREKAKEVNKFFWSAFKGFFNNKNHFFKELDAKREGNLKLKEELVTKANELKDNTDWENAANALKQLQRDWKEIGPVPEKHREEVYARFKAACDHFFNQRRSKNKEEEKGYEINLKEKESVCAELEKMAEEKVSDMDAFHELQDKFNAIGFVPKKSISSIKVRFADAVDAFVEALDGVSEEEKEKIKLENQLSKIKGGPNADQKLYRKEQAIRKQIGQIENDIALWKNNLEFFASSKTADKLKDEFNLKIENAGNELKHLKQQLRIIRAS